jgi:hypothetical protein
LRAGLAAGGCASGAIGAGSLRRHPPAGRDRAEDEVEIMLAARPQKITFGEMREMGVRGVLVYCADYRCGHSMALCADRSPHDLRQSDIEQRFVCVACGKRGAQVRPDFNWGKPRCRRWDPGIRHKSPSAGRSAEAGLKLLQSEGGETGAPDQRSTLPLVPEARSEPGDRAELSSSRSFPARDDGLSCRHA